MEKFGECANTAIEKKKKKNEHEHLTKRAEINKEQTLELAKVDNKGKEVGVSVFTETWTNNELSLNNSEHERNFSSVKSLLAEK